MRETLAIYDAQSYLCSLKQYHRLLRHLQTSKPVLLSQRVIHFEFESLYKVLIQSVLSFNSQFIAHYLIISRFDSKEIFNFQLKKINFNN